jgi:hypothetical protein
MHWFTIAWWAYLLKGCHGLRHFLCRLRGHPYGPVWFTLYRYEPDMHCRNCGDDLDPRA